LYKRNDLARRSICWLTRLLSDERRCPDGPTLMRERHSLDAMAHASVCFDEETAHRPA
jgi:hypothetical protein